MRGSRLLKLIIIMAGAIPIVWIQVSRRDIQHHRQSRIAEWAHHDWVGYAPTAYDPKRSISPSIASIRADLALIKATGFDGVITYESNPPFSQIPRIATELGLTVIQGVWGPADRKELQAAVELGDRVSGYCVGNEGLGTRYSIRELDEGVTYLSNRVAVPVAISEQIHVYFEHPELLDMGDWLFPIVHPHFGKAKTVDDALGWIDANTERLRRLAAIRGSLKPMFIKEIGMPSAGDGAYSELQQTRFLEVLLRRGDVRFAVFEAFDRQGWEYVSPVEPYWGIFRHDRSRKLAAASLERILRARSTDAR